MESVALTKAELSDLVEGWAPRGRELVKDVASNIGAALGGVIAAEKGPIAAIAAGSLLELGDAAFGPRHPWMQTLIGKPGVGMVDAGIGIITYLKRVKKKANNSEE